MCKTGYDYSWFILTQKIIARVRPLRLKQNADLTNMSVRCSGRAANKGAPGPVEAFKGVAPTLWWPVERPGAAYERADEEPLLDPAEVAREVLARDREVANPLQQTPRSRAFGGAQLPGRPADPRREARAGCLTPRPGPLIAVRLHILTRKTLGGLETDLAGGCWGRTARPCWVYTRRAK